MVSLDPLVNAAAEYVSQTWDTDEWRNFGRATGTSDIIGGHPRLYRSIGFGADDYPDAARAVLLQLLREAVDRSGGEPARLKFVAEFMPELAAWVNSNAAYRTKKLFNELLARLPSDAIPEEWVSDRTDLSLLRADKVDLEMPSDGDAWATSAKQGASWSASPAGQSAMTIALPNAPMGLSVGEKTLITAPEAPKRIFIVHGHDHASVREVQLYVHKVTGIMPDVLADLPGSGDTIIEKFEKNASAAQFAIVLLTPDDEGRVKNQSRPLQDRARQNVVLELGYFFGKLGRKYVAVLDAGVEQPSDVLGLSYIQFPQGNWKDKLRDELVVAELSE